MPSCFQSKSARGFTIIELVVVIAILSILAAVGLPRFLDTTEEAHQAAVEGVGGAFATAVLLVRAQNYANGDDGTATLNVDNFGNEDVDVNEEGYPVSTSSDVSTLTTAAHCVEVWEGILQNPPEAAVAAGTDIDYVATVAGNTCTYTYQPVTGKSIEYDSDDGEVDIDSL